MILTEPGEDNKHEMERLKALHAYDILNTSLDQEFDNITKIAALICQTPIALIAFTDSDTVWFKSAIGINFKQIPRQDSFCEYNYNDGRVFEIPDTHLDARFKSSPFVIDAPYIRHYAGASIINEDGYNIGTVSVYHTQPHSLSDVQKESLSMLAKQVMAQLSLQKKNQELQQFSQRFEEFVNIFTISPEIHCILDLKGQILFINDAVTDITGYTAQESIGKSMWDFCHPEDVEHARNVLRTGLANQAKKFGMDVRMVNKTGAITWVSWSLVAKNDRWYTYGRDITESKRVESELTQLSFVASKINNGVVISTNSEVKWVNRAFSEITGFTLEDVKGKRLGDLITGPKTDKALIAKAREYTENKQSFTLDLLAYRKDKTPIWITVYNTVVFNEDGGVDAEVEIILDITEKKMAEEQLQVLSLVASQTNAGVTISNNRGEITYVNEALENLTGFTFEELRGKMLGDVLSPTESSYEIVQEARKKGHNKEPYSIEVEVHRKDGSPLWLSVSNTPIINKYGKMERQIELIFDITERKQIEKEIIQSREQAMQLSEAKEMFLSVMSHEIRTPLNAIIGMTHLLLDNEPKPSQLEDLRVLKFSGENLLHIINEILDFTKIETGNLQLESVPFSLNSLVNDIINSLQVNANARGNKLRLDYDFQIPDKITGDKTRLYQILINLLGNSIKFTEQGHIELILQLQEDTETDALIYFEVKDSGIGIPEDKQSYIFESFTQAKTDISSKYGGTGLGLAITKKLLQLHQSEIQVHSQEGAGTSFTFSIRYPKALPKLLNAGEGLHIPEFIGKSILVVDDNDINILIAKRIFSKWGLHIDFAHNGQEAVEKVLSRPYDLVFMDLRMPIMDGFEACRAIRSRPENYYQNLPIIALTASTLSDESVKLKECGINGHLLKPFNPEEVKALLSRFWINPSL